MKFSDLDANKTYSAADYLSWDFEERVELIEGKVFEMSPAPNRLHQEIIRELMRELLLETGDFLKAKRCRLYVAPFDVMLPEPNRDDKAVFTVLQPDICVVCDPAKLTEHGCIGAPDLVVEVLSPGNNTRELKKKYEVYERAGVREYWIVSPQNQWIQVHTLIGSKFEPCGYLTTGDIVTSSVIEGFQLDVQGLFERAGEI